MGRVKRNLSEGKLCEDYCRKPVSLLRNLYYQLYAENADSRNEVASTLNLLSNVRLQLRQLENNLSMYN